MSKIEVCISPDLIHLHETERKKVVVVDIFRATSSMVAGLACGIAKIKPVAEVSESEYWYAQGFLRAGERNGVKVSGFDLGNSPFDFMDEKRKGAEVVMTTTNGTRAIAVANKASTILIGAFLNLDAVIDYLKSEIEQDVLIICAGWKGRLSMEDTLLAGALCQALDKDYQIFNDEALAAWALYRKVEHQLYDFLQTAGHAQRLKGLNFGEDIKFCLQKNRFQNLPVIKDGFIENM